MRKIILNEEQFKRLIKLLKEQNEDDEYYRIPPDEYKKLMKMAYYQADATYIKKFKGKPLYITGDLKLSDMPKMTDLGNVAYIDGNLDVSRTKISDISKTIVKGYVTDWGTPLEKRRIAREEKEKKDLADSRREDGEWDLDNPNIDDEGLMANALFQHLVSEGTLDEMDEDTKEEIESLKERIEELVQQGAQLDPNSEEREELYNEIDNLQEDIDNLIIDVDDVYSIIPKKYGHYEMSMFEVVGHRGKEYAVGTMAEAEESAVEYMKSILEDTKLEGIDLERYIDEDQVRDEMREHYESSIRDSPESWFDSDDYELTTEQEERKEQLENYISEMEDLKTEKEEELEGIGEDDEPGEMDIRKFLENNFNKKEIDLTKLIDGFAKENNISADRIRKFQRIIKLETEIEKIETNIDNAQDELDSIEPDTEPTEEMIEDKVESLVDGEEPIDYLTNMGADLKYYVDIDEIAEDIADSDGIGIISYNGDWDEQMVTTSDGTRHRFVIMRIN
jgi:hypothetical protein